MYVTYGTYIDKKNSRTPIKFYNGEQFFGDKDGNKIVIGII